MISPPSSGAEPLLHEFQVLGASAPTGTRGDLCCLSCREGLSRVGAQSGSRRGAGQSGAKRPHRTPFLPRIHHLLAKGRGQTQRSPALSVTS